MKMSKRRRPRTTAIGRATCSQANTDCGRHVRANGSQSQRLSRSGSLFCVGSCVSDEGVVHYIMRYPPVPLFRCQRHAVGAADSAASHRPWRRNNAKGSKKKPESRESDVSRSRTPSMTSFCITRTYDEASGSRLTRAKTSLAQR